MTKLIKVTYLVVEVFWTFCIGANNSKIQILYIQDATIPLYCILPKSKAGVKHEEGFYKYMHIFCHPTVFEPQNTGQVILGSKFVANKN